MTATGPLSLLLHAVERIARGERTAAWRDVRQAIAAAPRDGLVGVLASRIFYLLGDHRAAIDASRAAAQLGVESAAMLHYEQARDSGRYHEARAVLEEMLRPGERVSTPERGAPPRLHQPIDRVLGHLLQLYFDAHDYAGAAAMLDRYLAGARGSPGLYLRAARVYERRGETDAARAAIHRALAEDEPTAATLLDAAPLLLEIGAFDEARATYERLLEHDGAADSALEALGRLCLWRGDVAGALAHAEQLCARDRGSQAGRRIRAAVCMLQGDYANAAPLLDAVLHDYPDDAEAYVWRAEAHLRFGRRDEALADAQRSPPGSSHSFAARAIHVLAALGPAGQQDARPAGSHAGGTRRLLAALRPDRWARRSGAVSDRTPGRTTGGIAAHARHELAAELSAIDPRAARLLASNDLGAVAALLERSLAAMCGNRTPLATWVRPDGTLARLPRSTSARVASRQILDLIKIASADEVFRRFDDLIARLPDSSMPLVHRGELQLWLGRYAEARADLEAAIAIQRQTRWAWYGLACLDLLAGDPERALATCAFGIRVMDNTEGPVAFVYRGEAYRVLGRLDEARQQLQRASELHPRRLSAWINLALVQGASGDDAVQRDVFARVAASAPSLLAEAARELGEDAFRRVVLERPGPSGGGPDAETMNRVLQQSLAMMRGNRSSSCITYFTNDGQMRHVPQGQQADPGADARTLAQLRQVLVRAGESRRAVSN